jgi:nicotinate-nucleotide--dimethylbenzimidazole phosphoribosyltransferase
VSWPRPVPLIGDATSAQERAAEPGAWRMPDGVRRALHEVIAARRDIRRYRPDPVDDEILQGLLEAAHRAPSVGQSQPWRFVVVRDADTRARAAWMADRCRLAQAAELEPEAARHLLDLQLEGIREAPVGVVVCCDRRVAAAGVLGRATFADADLWSCACAIQNLWLAARAEGLGMGWVTLFEPAELSGLLGLPDGVVPLGWLCLGWPDERPPAPGLERAGWSRRVPLSEVVVRERWPGADLDPPVSRARGGAGAVAPSAVAVVEARDGGDDLLTPGGSLGVLDRALERAAAAGGGLPGGGALLLAAGRHPVADLGVSAFDPSVTDDVVAATRAGTSVGAVTAAGAGLAVSVVDAGSSVGNLRDADALPGADLERLVALGRSAAGIAGQGPGRLLALGEVGVANTVVSAALTCVLLDAEPAAVVGRGAGADTAMVERRRSVVEAAVGRARASHGATALADPIVLLGALGGPELAVLTGAVLEAAATGRVVVLDGLATSVAALLAAEAQPGVVDHLVAGQRSREPAHAAVLARLGLEPLLDLRIRAGEGAGACLAAGLLLHAAGVRAGAARTREREAGDR